MGTGLGILAADGPDFMIHGLVKFHLFGQELWLTTTHVSVLVVCVLLIIFALIVRSKLRDTEGEPGTLQNIAEMVVEALDGMVKGSMGKKWNPLPELYRNAVFIPDRQQPVRASWTSSTDSGLRCNTSTWCDNVYIDPV